MLSMNAADVKRELEALSHPDKAAIFQRFFKTGPGEYGEGDLFIGVTMPEQRAIAKKYTGLSFLEIERLLNSTIHEHRMTGLLILTYQYAAEKERTHGSKKDTHNSAKRKEEIYTFYMKNLHAVNNWDLVDVTVPRIVGTYLYEHQEKSILYKLVKSKNLWERRVAVLATYPFIKKDDFTDIITLCELLLDDEHDLLHKATGWMLREVGKRGEKGLTELKRFLTKHLKRMPRTMLRYAIERFPETERKAWLVK